MTDFMGGRAWQLNSLNDTGEAIAVVACDAVFVETVGAVDVDSAGVE